MRQPPPIYQSMAACGVAQGALKLAGWPASVLRSRGEPQQLAPGHTPGVAGMRLPQSPWA